MLEWGGIILGAIIIYSLGWRRGKRQAQEKHEREIVEVFMKLDDAYYGDSEQAGGGRQ